jgi:hypothetical protein
MSWGHRKDLKIFLIYNQDSYGLNVVATHGHHIST